MDKIDKIAKRKELLENGYSLEFKLNALCNETIVFNRNYY
jgi:hypothetical protein